MITPKFKTRSTFTPQRLMRQQKRIRKRFLYSAGGFGSKVAKRSLRKARKIRVSELPDEAREEYREALEDFQNGYRDKPPVLGTIVSEPGKPPLTHVQPSPLKQLLKFSVDSNATFVVWGPEKSRDGIAGDLEFGRGKIKQPRPFVGPSYKTTLPKLPTFFRQAVSKG